MEILFLLIALPALHPPTSPPQIAEFEEEKLEIAQTYQKHVAGGAGGTEGTTEIQY